MVTVNKFSDKPSLAKNLGEIVLQAQDAALQKGDVFNLAISGGSLVNVLHATLIEDKELAGKVKWEQWRVYFCDERIVPLDHADSNYGAFKTAVLDKLQANVKVFPIDESLVNGGPEEFKKIAANYAAIIPKSFDLILLGCGPDGHTCSLFPGEAHKYLLQERDERVSWCHDSPKPPPNRVTFTIPVLEDAKQLVFVAEGASKQEIMHEIFDLKNAELPTAIINNLFTTKVTWLVNDEAFAKVTTC
ncbi:6-phosphogluconolactonase 3 [Nakaseomyces bracarensis]|uniref:6-phosphogluconolactonase-like protein n=1 Tax=Nakaseomyces bracarensis TaxID=273131 RepID=A0ABR4NM17_9SACH